MNYKHCYYYVGAYFTPESAISRNEDVGNVPFCVNYTSRDDLPQTVNVSVNSRPDDGKYRNMLIDNILCDYNSLLCQNSQ